MARIIKTKYMKMENNATPLRYSDRVGVNSVTLSLIIGHEYVLTVEKSNKS